MTPISPLILQAQITPPATGGSFGLADTTLLENPFQAPMWLDEIRFRLPGGTRGTAASNISVELRLGEVPITKGFVPIRLFGKELNSDYEYGSSDVYTWRLPKPLFIPARELLRPTMYYEPFVTGTGATKTVTIIYCCRPLPRGTPPPKTLQVPWVTFFKPPMLTISALSGAADTTNLSTPSDLYNPFDQDLRVQRFIGRLMVQYSGTQNLNFSSLESANVSLTTGLVTTGTMISAQDSFNNILIRDMTPFAHVFDFIDRAWTVNCVLPPKGFYLFTIDRLWSGYRKALVASVGIGMVGYREVPNR